MTITPYLVDHFAPDAYAFLVESEGKRLFYSGDFRGYGRKRALFERLTQYSSQVIDALLIEGTTIGKGKSFFASETDVEARLFLRFCPQDGRAMRESRKMFYKKRTTADYYDVR